MNIFYLDENPYKAAVNHSDKHLVKMILETAQILMTNYHKLQGFNKKKEFTNDYILNHLHDFPRRTENDFPHPYGMTHPNHPSTVWARESFSNFMWTLRLGGELCREYTRRYDKIHKSEKVFDWINQRVANLMKCFDKNIMTQPALAMPKELHDIDFVNTLLDSVKCPITENLAVNAYRAYYIFYKKDINKWNKGDKPLWYPAIELINEKINLLQNGNQKLIIN